MTNRLDEIYGKLPTLRYMDSDNIKRAIADVFKDISLLEFGEMIKNINMDIFQKRPQFCIYVLLHRLSLLEPLPSINNYEMEIVKKVAKLITRENPYIYNENNGDSTKEITPQGMDELTGFIHYDNYSVKRHEGTNANSKFMQSIISELGMKNVKFAILTKGDLAIHKLLNRGRKTNEIAKTPAMDKDGRIIKDAIALRIVPEENLITVRKGNNITPSPSPRGESPQ